MTDVTISQERAEDAAAIERLHDRVFGPGRYAKTAYRIREQVPHSLDLSYTAWVGTLMVGSIWMSKVRIGETPALLLGPLTVDPPFRERGIGQLLMQKTMDDARAKGHKLVVLVGDEPYYAKAGFKVVPKGQCTMPGPVDPARLLVCELVDGAFRNVGGVIRGGA